jgi:hypothetical protein
MALHAVTDRLWSFLSVPLRPQTYLNLLYLLLAFPLGLAYLLVFTLGLSLGIGLLVVLAGAPILVLSVSLALGIGSLERRLTRFFLDVDLSGRPSVEGERLRERAWNLVTDPGTWLALLYLPVKFVFGVVALLVLLHGLVTGGALLFVPFHYTDPSLYVGIVRNRPVEFHPALHIGWNRLLVGVETVITLGFWRVTTLAEALAVAVIGAVVCLLGLHLLNALARLNGRVARWLLDGSYDPVSAFQS